MILFALALPIIRRIDISKSPISAHDDTLRFEAASRLNLQGSRQRASCGRYSRLSFRLAEESR